MNEVELAFHASAWPTDALVKSLEDITKAGYRAMEALDSVVPMYEDRVLVFQEMLTQQGIALAAIESRLRTIELEIIEEEVERCANVARFCRANGAEYIILYPPKRRDSGDDAEDLALAYEAINQVGRRTLDLDVRTCICPWYGTVAENKREVDKLMDNTDPEYIRICASSSFLTWAGMSVSSFFKRYADRIDYIRIADLRKPRERKGRPQSPQDVSFGRGIVNFESFARQVEAIDYSGWLSVESRFVAKNTEIDAAGTARSLTRKAFGLE